jgi:hypothetical protein
MLFEQKNHNKNFKDRIDVSVENILSPKSNANNSFLVIMFYCNQNETAIYFK